MIVYFKVNILQFIPIICDVVIKLFSLKTAIEHLPDKIIVRFLVELYRFNVVDKVNDFKRHFMA